MARQKKCNMHRRVVAGLNSFKKRKKKPLEKNNI